MPLTGTQPALTEARVGMMRMGGSRLGYVLAIPYVEIDGFDRTNNCRVAGASVWDILNGTPNTATMRVDGFTPTEGHEVILSFGVSGPTQFRGRILSTNKIYETGNKVNVAWDCSCISEELLLNQRKVTKRYLSMSATAIILDLFATYAPGFSTDGVAAGLPSIDEITFTSEDLTDCLDRICKRIGEDWQLDYDRVLHIPAADGTSVNAITDSDDHGMSGIAVSTDLSQVRTRQPGEGGGSNTSIDVAVGQNTIPLDDTSWYSGGTVKSGPQIIAYTGKSTGDGTGSKVAGKTGLAPGIPTSAVVNGVAGNLFAGDYRYAVSFVINGGETEVGNNSTLVTIGHVAAPSALTATTVSETAGNLSVGPYTYKVTYVTAAGETDGGSASSTASVTAVPDANAPPSVAATTTGSLTSGAWYSYKVSFTTAIGQTIAWSQSASVEMTGANNAVSLTSIPVSSDDRVTGRKIYRHGQGVAVIHDWALVATIADNTGTSHTDTVADASVGVPPPMVHTASSGKIDLSAIPVSSDGRVTKRKVYRTQVNGTSYRLLTTINDNSTTTYSDNTSDASLGLDAPTVNTSGSGQLGVGFPVGPAGTTARILYRSPVNIVSISGYKYLTTIPDNGTITFADNIGDSGLGAKQAPVSSTVGPFPGDTTLAVQDLSLYLSTGGWVHLGSQVVRYTGRSGTSGPGTLTGIPSAASGEIGAITASVPYDTPVLNAPHLTGVSGIVYAINQGEPVNLWVTRNDTAAQAFMAAALTTATYTHDGIIEADPIQDRRMSETEITARCDAKLEELKDPLVTVRYQTRDVTTRSGRTVTVTLGAPTNISGTFTIQSVTTSGFSPNGEFLPLRNVECSSRLLTFDQILRIRKAAA